MSQTTTFVEELKNIIAELASAEEDATKLDGGNVSAGKRLRDKSLIAISSLKNLRKTTQVRRNIITAGRRTEKSSD